MYRIFVIEDDRALAGAIRRENRILGNEVQCANHLQNIIPELLSITHIWF